MTIRGILPMLVVSMMVLTPLSMANHEGGDGAGASTEPRMSQAENVSGWLASAGGASYERVSAMVLAPNGSMLVGGLFEQNVEFHGDVIGFSSEDSSFGVDFFLGWVDENGTWTGDTWRGRAAGSTGSMQWSRTSDGTVIIAGTFCGHDQGDACNMTLGELRPGQQIR